MPRDNRCMYMAHVCCYVCCSDCVGVCGNVCCVAAVVKDSVFLNMGVFGHFIEKYRMHNCNQKHLQNVIIIVRNS